MKLKLIITSIALIAVTLSSCSGPSEAAQPQIATFIFIQEFDTLNPLYTNMWFSKITQQLWNCWAWDYDDQNNPHPVLVQDMPSLENGGISADGKTITLKLREDLKWSDGKPLTANDFVFTYQMIIAPKNAVSSRYPYDSDKMESVEAYDDHTVVMKFVTPFAPWIAVLWHGILPAHILQPVFDEEGTLDNAEWNLAPTVGCGPYVFDEWESGSFARFKANKNYWLDNPKIDEIFIRFVPEAASQVAAMTSGDADLGALFAYEEVPILEKANLKVFKVYTGFHEGWWFYMNPQKGHPALRDVRVRQALAYGFDRFSLCKDLLLGLTVPAATYWDNLVYTDPEIKPYPYDPDKARQLLDEAGWVDSNGDGVRDKDGVELILKYGTTTRKMRQDTQVIAQQQLADIGIKVELLNYQFDVFAAGYANGGPITTGQLDIFEYANGPFFPDPDHYEWLCSEIPSDDNPAGRNYVGLCDEKLDRLFKLQATQMDFKVRQQIFHEITRYIFEQAYWIGLWQDARRWALSPRISNAKISGVTPFYNIAEWDLSE